MTTDIDSADSTSHVDDILTGIKGLGKTAERDLHSLGIRGFADLAKDTPEELAKKLYEHTKNSKYSVKFIETSDWIGQARQKLAERKKDASSSPQADAPARPNAQASENQTDDWKLQAEFTLYFENKVSGQGKETWRTRVWKNSERGREYDEHETFVGID
jgi:nucleotidyltransferase/DNA polymerase involved in DNA repair